MKSFEEILDLCAKAHGHMCPGQVLGARMAILGLALLGLEAPLNGRDIKKVIIFVEIDRCAADALGTATGVKLGRRSLKFMDYGLMAATFIHLEGGRAYRVAVREDCRVKAAELRPDIEDAHAREQVVYRTMPASDLFTVESVKVELKPEDMPGYSNGKAVCDSCGTVVRHRREVYRDGQCLCPVCAGGAYFESINPVDGIDKMDPVCPGPEKG